MRKIHWNNLARNDYFKNIDYLLENWTEKEAQIFIDEVFEAEFILLQEKIEFQDTNFPGIKRCFIRKQITLFYKVIDDKNIELLRFWNSFQDDKKPKF